MIDRKYFDEKLKAHDKFINKQLEIICQDELSSHPTLAQLISSLEKFKSAENRGNESEFRQPLLKLRALVADMDVSLEKKDPILKAIAEAFSTSVDEELLNKEKKEFIKKNNALGLLKEMEEYTKNLKRDMKKLSDYFIDLTDMATLVVSTNSSPKSKSPKTIRDKINPERRDSESPKIFLRSGSTSQGDSSSDLDKSEKSFRSASLLSRPLFIKPDSSPSMMSSASLRSLRSLSRSDSPRSTASSLPKQIFAKTARNQIRLLKEDDLNFTSTPGTADLPGTPQPIPEETSSVKSFPFRSPYTPFDSDSASSLESDEMTKSSTPTSDSPTMVTLPAQLAEYFRDAEGVFFELNNTCHFIFSQQHDADAPLNLQLNSLCDELNNENFTQFISAAIRASQLYVFLHSYMDMLFRAYPEALSPNIGGTTEFNNMLAKSFQCLMRYELLLKEIEKNLPENLTYEEREYLLDTNRKIARAVEMCNKANQDDVLASFRTSIEKLLLSLELERKKLHRELLSPTSRKINLVSQRLEIINEVITSTLDNLRHNSTIDQLVESIIKITSPRGDNTSPLERRSIFSPIRSASSVTQALQLFTEEVAETKKTLTSSESLDRRI